MSTHPKKSAAPLCGSIEWFMVVDGVDDGYYSIVNTDRRRPTCAMSGNVKIVEYLEFFL